MKNLVVSLSGRLSINEAKHQITFKTKADKKLEAIYNECEKFNQDNNKVYNPIMYKPITKSVSINLINTNREGYEKSFNAIISSLKADLGLTFLQGLQRAASRDINFTFVIRLSNEGDTLIDNFGKQVIDKVTKEVIKHKTNSITLSDFEFEEADSNMVSEAFALELEHADSLTRSLSVSSLPKRTSDSILASIAIPDSSEPENDIPENDIPGEEEHSVNLAEIAEEPKGSKKK